MEERRDFGRKELMVLLDSWTLNEEDRDVFLFSKGIAADGRPSETGVYKEFINRE